ncbi:MAG: class I SAM-dependent methyltransferase [Dehalococcoidales bacterium]|jgi:2-polyprenyl-3-methyl-5-hydroxy-6-metoxy-1,4-benzoquinol methylase
MDKYLEYNKAAWNESIPIHEKSAFYDVAGFKAGKKMMLMPFELDEVGDVRGKSLLHLQCHFGMDTLTWGRRGAKVTGVDFSEDAISLARKLSKETGIKGEFICSDIYELQETHQNKYDIVYTSGGVLCWLPDLNKWGKIIAHFLKPGGFFYIMEGHPFMMVFDNSKTATQLNVANSYFHRTAPTRWEPDSDYADPAAITSYGSYEWTHSLGDIINGLIGAGLKIEFLHEHTAIFYKVFPFMTRGKDGFWHLEGDKLPLVFSLKAVKVKTSREKS